MSRIYLLLLAVCVSESMSAQEIYHAKPVREKVIVDGNWDKAAWKEIQPVTIANRMGKEPMFRPSTEAKLLFDEQNIYLIFRVRDKFVKSTVTTTNGAVSHDSCVEFFFSPNPAQPGHYFNLEVNAGGTPLIFFVTKPRKEYIKLPDTLIEKIEIAHSLPAVVNPEIQEEVTWTIECRVPLQILKSFTDVATPGPGVRWRANFYKTASETSNPHYYTWSPVSNPEPDFHLPAYFGTIIFDF